MRQFEGEEFKVKELAELLWHGNFSAAAGRRSSKALKRKKSIFCMNMMKKNRRRKI